MTRTSQDWVGENVTVKTKSPTSEEEWEVLRLINGGAAHPFKLAFGGEGNGPVTHSPTTQYHQHCAPPQKKQRTKKESEKTERHTVTLFLSLSFLWWGQ